MSEVIDSFNHHLPVKKYIFEQIEDVERNFFLSLKEMSSSLG